MAEWEQIHGKNKAKVCLDINWPSEKRVKTGDAGGRASWRSSLLGDPSVKFFYEKLGECKKKRKEERNGLTLTGLLMEGLDESAWYKRHYSGLFLGPRRHDAGHPGVRDQLSHVLVRMNDDAKIHAVHSRISASDFDLAPEILGRGRCMSRFNSVQRPLEPSDHLRFRGDSLFHVLVQVSGPLGAGDAKEIL